MIGPKQYSFLLIPAAKIGVDYLTVNSFVKPVHTQTARVGHSLLLIMNLQSGDFW